MSAALKTRLASTTILGGGLDLVTPPIGIKPGSAIAACNYEATDSGYRRCDGFERYDGQPKPSDAQYAYLPFSTGTQTLTAGQTVTGGTSSASGKLVIDMVVTSGSVGSSNAVGYLVLTTLSGTFVSGENIRLSGVTKAVSTDVSTAFGAPTDGLNATYAQAAVEMARALVQPVPGINQIRGVWMFDGGVYAFRDDAGGSNCNIYKASSSGWSQIVVGSRINFATSPSPDFDMPYGTTTYTKLTGASSGATAHIQRQITITGSAATGDAAGYFIVTNVSGTFTAGEGFSLKGNNGAGIPITPIDATLVDMGFGMVEAQDVFAGGQFEFVNYNFYAATNLQAMYAVNGKNRALEIRNGCVANIDSTGFVVVTSGNARFGDKPIRVGAHKNHLFLGFTGGRIDCSVAGISGSFDGLLGAAEFGLGYEITAMWGEVLDTMWIFTTDQIKILYGSSADPSSSDPFTLKALSPDAGAVAGSVQNVGILTYMDRQGVRTTNATQAYGNFSIGTLTRAIVPLLNLKRALGVTVTGSVRCRNKSQYRLFFSDGTGISIYIGKTKDVGGTTVPVIMAFDLGMTVRAVCSGVDSNNVERLFYGSDDGYIYNLDAGYSCDGQPLTSYLRLAFDTCASPSVEKRFMDLTLEVSKEFWAGDTAPTANLAISAEFNYAAPYDTPTAESDFTPVVSTETAQSGTGGFWDDMTWEDFMYDTALVGRPRAYIDGIGRNVSPSIRCISTYEPPHTVHSYELQFSARRMSS